MKLEVAVTSVTQTASPVLGTEEKTLYYLILGEGEKKAVINVGKKTHDTVAELTKPREEKTVINVLPPEEKKK